MDDFSQALLGQNLGATALFERKAYHSSSRKLRPAPWMSGTLSQVSRNASMLLVESDPGVLGRRRTDSRAAIAGQKLDSAHGPRPPARGCAGSRRGLGQGARTGCERGVARPAPTHPEGQPRQPTDPAAICGSVDCERSAQDLQCRFPERTV